MRFSNKSSLALKSNSSSEASTTSTATHWAPNRRLSWKPSAHGSPSPSTCKSWICQISRSWKTSSPTRTRMVELSATWRRFLRKSKTWWNWIAWGFPTWTWTTGTSPKICWISCNLTSIWLISIYLMERLNSANCSESAENSKSHAAKSNTWASVATRWRKLSVSHGMTHRSKQAQNCWHQLGRTHAKWKTSETRWSTKQSRTFAPSSSCPNHSWDS